jgi:ABC-2 type transport system permease protein
VSRPEDDLVARRGEGDGDAAVPVTGPRRILPSGPQRRVSPTLAVYRLVLRSQVTRGRVAGLGALGVLAVLLGLAIGMSSQAFDRVSAGTGFVNAYGLQLLVPVTALVFAAAALGDPDEDGTLVYLWLRPVARWRIVIAAYAASLTAVVPLVVVPLTVASALVGATAKLVVATAAATTLASVTYVSVFLFLGLRVRRALVWGLAYILVWEGFVARGGASAARLAVRTYTRTLLTRMAEGPAGFASVALATAVAVPLVATAVFLVLTVRRLRHQDVA